MSIPVPCRPCLQLLATGLDDHKPMNQSSIPTPSGVPITAKMSLLAPICDTGGLLSTAQSVQLSRGGQSSNQRTLRQPDPRGAAHQPASLACERRLAVRLQSTKWGTYTKGPQIARHLRWCYSRPHDEAARQLVINTYLCVTNLWPRMAFIWSSPALAKVPSCFYHRHFFLKRAPC